MSTSWSHDGRRIEKQVRTTAEPALAFQAWTDPEKIAHWFVDRATGPVEPGGTYVWEWERFGFKVPYQVLEVVPDERLVLGSAMPPGVLEITIAKDGGDTVVTLINSGFSDDADWADEFEGIDSGWQRVLAQMKRYVERHFGTPRASFMVMRPATFEYEDLVHLYRDPDALQSWLTASGAPDHDGGAFSVTLRDGGPWSGELLTKSPRESCFSWNEIDGVLELTAFKMGPSRYVALRGHGWALDPARASEIERDLEKAMDRLVSRLGGGAAQEA